MTAGLLMMRNVPSEFSQMPAESVTKEVTKVMYEGLSQERLTVLPIRAETTSAGVFELTGLSQFASGFVALNLATPTEVGVSTAIDVDTCLYMCGG